MFDSLRTACVAATLALLALPASAQSTQKAERAKLPVPEKEVAAIAEKVVKDLFKAEFASRKPEERAAFAEKLLKQGVETIDDPASTYVLLRQAIEVGSGLGEVEVTFKSLNELTSRYDVVESDERFDVLSALSRSAKGDNLQALLSRTLSSIDEAVVADQYDTAKKLVTLGTAIARRAQASKELASLATRTRQLDLMKKEFEKSREAQATLASKPDDPDANFVVGKFLCFVKGDFEAGLSCLAKGSDLTLKQLAMKELANPKETEAQLAIGDGWWVYADKEKDAKATIQDHAAEWYSQALPNLKGLPKSQVEAKIKSVTASADGPPKKTSPTTAVNQLVGNKWKFDFSGGQKYLWMVFRPDGTCENHMIKGTWAVEGKVFRVKYPEYPDCNQVYWFEGGKLLADWKEKGIHVTAEGQKIP